MEQFILDKIEALRQEREELDAIRAAAEDVMTAGLAQQEITRNEGLLALYHGICEQWGWHER